MTAPVTKLVKIAPPTEQIVTALLFKSGSLSGRIVKLQCSPSPTQGNKQRKQPPAPRKLLTRSFKEGIKQSNAKFRELAKELASKSQK